MTPLERKALKARAHPLNPVVIIGDKGITDSVIGEIDRALTAHELIKVRAPAMERADRESALAEIAMRCGAEAVQSIGKVLVLYRPRPIAEKTAKPEKASRKRPSRRPPGAGRR